ncbi:MAG: class SAM-dependent methyltransferase [Flavipsychrobacter sp.]|jgi:SAM-dependent methyltransferase|nr:class SAM-dependent methyltransferase [Flavipsychrobacter sp.]
MKQVIDNFSTGSSEYATFRPESPKEIFDFVSSQLTNFNAAWDCGTGNGQVAAVLADKFKLVYGTDISQQQLSLAQKRDNIIYLNERAEQTTLPANGIDLITIAQAIHWFDFGKFYTEVNRVAVPGGIIAAWTYSTMKLTPEIDAVIDRLYEDITGPYWDKERRYVDEGYRTIPFPFKEISAPEFRIVKHWPIDQFVGYLRTWSGVKHYVAKEGQDPVSLVMDDLKKAWGSKELHEIRWPVHTRIGIVK